MVDIPNPMAILGAMPIGDPGAMRELAGRLRAAAASVDSLGDDLNGKAQAMTYQGSGARKFRARVRGIQSTTNAQAASLRALAATLDREAAELQAKQDTWRRRFAEIEAEARRLLRRAQDMT